MLKDKFDIARDEKASSLIALKKEAIAIYWQGMPVDNVVIFMSASYALMQIKVDGIYSDPIDLDSIDFSTNKQKQLFVYYN